MLRMEESKNTNTVFTFEPARKSNQTKLLQVTIPSAIIILFYALESLMTVKDHTFYENFVLQNGELDFASFVNLQTLLFLGRIAYPVLLSLYTALTIQKWGIPPLYPVVWGLLGLSALIWHLVDLRAGSIFYFLNTLAYILLLFFLARIRKDEKVK